MALLYREELISIISESYFPSSDTLLALGFKTRYVLYAKCLSKQSNDTFHVFVNHWPSKVGNSKMSGGGRMFISKMVRQKCDSIFTKDSAVKIIIMGDLNDTPDSEAVMNLCREGKMINLTSQMLQQRNVFGSYKYKGKWEAIDHFLVSDSVGCVMDIFDHQTLLERDKNFLGVKIKRTNVGPRYRGGASDHLPIVLTIKNGK